MLELDSPARAAAWLRRHVTGTLQTDSRTLAPGDGFIAWPEIGRASCRERV